MAPVGVKTARFYFFRNINTFLLGVVAFYSLLPLLYLMISATKTQRDIFTTFGLWFGSNMNLWANLQEMTTYGGGIYFRWLANTLVYSAISAAGATVLCTLIGYAFAKYRFVGRDAMYGIILGALMVPQTVLAIPIFLMFAKVGLVDNPLAVILPSLVFVPGVFLMHVYARQTVPTELIEAARVDGAGELRIFVTISLPLMAPGLATVFILSFVGAWNNYFLPMVVLNSTDLLPLTVGLASWFAAAANNSGGASLHAIILTGALVSVVPIVAVFLFTQRYWQSGLTTGALK